MNASTASVLQVSSSLVDPYSAVAAGVASLYGPLHGGAAEAVVRQLLLIGSPENVPEYLEKVKRKERTLSGFGHRVYRTTEHGSTRQANEPSPPRYRNPTRLRHAWPTGRSVR